MNQILNNDDSEINEFTINTTIAENKSNTNSNGITKYKIQFILSGLVSIIFLFIFFVNIYNNNQKEKISRKLLNLYNISTLYSNTTNYISEDMILDNPDYSDPFVIGMIKIEKIDLNYPILSNSNKELLKISLCRFAGPMPNEIGNLCVAGHNYVDYKFFSRLNELTNEDIIQIYDLSGKMLEYSVYEKYEVRVNDTSCTFQETNNEKIVTLLTCNNVNGKRLVVHAKENR